MASEPTTHPRPSLFAVLLNYLLSVLLIGVFGATLFLAWPTISARLFGAAPAAAPVAPTAIVVPPRPQAAPQTQPQAAPAIPGIAQNEATATAAYNAAVRAAEAVPNVDTTGDTAPVQLVQQPAEERHAAGDNVPTAEPIVEAESGDMFGSKPVLVNPQATHECKHGQIWIDGKGCRNP